MFVLENNILMSRGGGYLCSYSCFILLCSMAEQSTTREHRFLKEVAQNRNITLLKSCKKGQMLNHNL